MSLRVPIFCLNLNQAARVSPVACLRSICSRRNIAKVSSWGEDSRKSGKEFLSAREQTNSVGGIPGRIVRSQEPKEVQTSLGKLTDRYWSSPWATRPIWIKRWYAGNSFGDVGELVDLLRRRQWNIGIPRQARLDFPGTLHHVICGGIEKQEIVTDDRDRDNFVLCNTAWGNPPRQAGRLFTHGRWWRITLIYCFGAAPEVYRNSWERYWRDMRFPITWNTSGTAISFRIGINS